MFLLLFFTFMHCIMAQTFSHQQIVHIYTLQASLKPNEMLTIYSNNLFLELIVFFFINTNIFHYLKLGIMLAIPASKA